MTVQTITFDEAAAFVLPSDKYRGETLAEAYKADPAYVRWLAKQMVPTHDVGRQVKAAAVAFWNGIQTPTQAPAKANGKANGHKPAPANGDQKQRPRIFSIITKNAILHLEDALEIEKIKLFMVAYQRGKGSSATAIHYMDLSDARVLAEDLTTGRLAKYIEYKGSPKGRNGKPLSRVLKVGDRGDQAKRPIVIQVQNGPGELVGEGAIKPAGNPDAEVTIFLTRWEARKMGMALRDYIRAWQAAKFVLTPPETI